MGNISEKNEKLKGVYFHETTSKYIAKIAKQNFRLYISTFSNPKDAYKAFYEKYVEIFSKPPFDFNEIEKTSFVEIKKIEKKGKKKKKEKRRCLRCSKIFDSFSLKNRICEKCKTYNKEIY